MSGLAGLYDSNLFLNHFYGFLDLQPRVPPPANPAPLPRPMRDGINLEEVTFYYPLSNREALKDINLKIRPGEVIALVGDNGAGKTTLAIILCRLYDSEKGGITTWLPFILLTQIYQNYMIIHEDNNIFNIIKWGS